MASAERTKNVLPEELKDHKMAAKYEFHDYDEESGEGKEDIDRKILLCHTTALLLLKWPSIFITVYGCPKPFRMALWQQSLIIVFSVTIPSGRLISSYIYIYIEFYWQP